MLPTHSQISAKAIRLASPLDNKDNLFLSLRFCNVHISEAVVESGSVKKMFLKISHNSQVFSLPQVFPVNFAKF